MDFGYRYSGMSPNQVYIRQMAELVLKERVDGASSILGKHWVGNFISWHSKLKTRYNRKYDYQRAKCEDPKIMEAWFKLVQNTIAKYGIREEDIYNFDETGFQMGVITTSKVVTTTDKPCAVLI